jgi:hypothetical protein
MDYFECLKGECQYWNEELNECSDDEIFIDPDTGETCCRYYDGAISEIDYSDLVDECTTEYEE